MSVVVGDAPVGRRIFRHAGLIIGAALTALLVLVAIVSLVWTPQSATAIDVARKLAPPSAAHWLGTDHFGRDVASMLMVGAQNSIMVGIVAVSIGVGIGVACGLAAAARGGWVEEALMRLADFTFAFPAVLSAILITALLGPGAFNSILAIGIFNVPAFARLSRTQAAEKLRAANTAFGLVNDVAAFSHHPALRRAVVETRNGAVSLAAPPVLFSDGARQLGPVPALGEHSAAIRAEFGN